MTFKVAARNVFRHRTKNILLCLALGFSLFITMVATTLTLGIVENAYHNISGLFYGNVILWNFKKVDNEVIKGFEPSFDPGVEKWNYSIKETTKRTAFIGRLVFNDLETTQQCFGINWEKETTIKERLALKEGRIEDIIKNEKAIIISNKIAQKLDLRIGDNVLIAMKTIKGQGNVIDCIVMGISHDIWVISGINAFAHRSYVNKALDMKPGSFNEYNIILNNPRQAAALENELREALKDKGKNLGQRSLSDVLSTLGRDVNTEHNYFYIGILSRLFPLIDSLLILVQIGAYVLMAIMLFITGVGIANSLQLIVAERTREIGTMMAIGAKKKVVRSLFYKELLIIALIGTGCALFFYLLVLIIAGILKFSQDNSLYLFLRNGRITFKFVPWQQLLNLGAVFCVTFLAGISPVKKAAELNPIEALRH